MLLRRWRSLPGPCSLKFGLEHLPLMNAMMKYSTNGEPKKADADTESAQLPPYPKHLNKLPPWIDVPPVHKNSDALKMVYAEATAFKEQSENKNLRAAFDEKIRSFLVSRCLLCKYPRGGRLFKKIHFMNQAIIGRFPSYVTCITLMKLLVTRSEAQHRPILESLVDERIVVLMDWVNEPTTIEILFYDHGQLLATQSGTPSDSIIYKAECDACFYEDAKFPLDKMKAQKSLPVGNKGQNSSSMQGKGRKSSRAGTAAVASLIWKSGKPFECQAIRDIRCVGSQHAEATALLSVLKRGRMHGIEILDVVTDCEENCHIMMGKRPPSQSEHPETCMAFLQASKEYTVCKCRWEPREMISHVNDIARAAYSSDAFDLTEILEEKSPCFWGMPFVRVIQNRTKAIDSLGAVKVKRKKIKCASTYYISVEEDVQKADALEGVVEVLHPSFMVVLVSSHVSACNVRYRLSHTYSGAIWSGESQIDHIGDCSSTPFSAYILADQSVVPYFLNEKKTLVVVYDSLPNPIQYSSSQDTKGVIHVHMVGPHDTMPMSSRQVDPFLFGFFRYPGTKGVVLKENPDSSDDSDGYSDESSDESSDEGC